ncbi:major capsid protein [Burkholderia anthina]|uniref:major capsid protein n=1 Tax=Burkholderia anthina TaxID=179879 RepID=UPI00158DB5EA|nr:major capsid protein [Burkholderia anthina]
MMTLEQIRLRQNPILTSLLLGLGQGTFAAGRLLPALPQALSGITLAKLGDERLRRYNLRRAPGTATKRVDITFEGVVYNVQQYSVEVPMPRELLREADESRKLNVGNHLSVSQIAMATANDVLLLDYELETAGIATNPDSYAPGHSIALAGGTKWSADTGTPVTDITAASNTVRKKIGKKPNTLLLSADASTAVRANKEVKSYLPSTQQGPATDDQLKQIFNVRDIVVGDAVWVNGEGVGQDVWGNNAVLAYVPTIAANGSSDISLAEPAFGFTNVLPGHPFAEAPYYENGSKSWIYGATYERQPNIAYDTAGFLFTNPL